MFKVVAISFVLSFLIITGGLYSNNSLPMIEFMDLADHYYQQKFQEETVQTPIQEQYLSLIQEICTTVARDSYHNSFDQLIEFSDQVIYSRRVLLGDLYEKLATAILRQILQDDMDTDEVKKFLMRRHEQIQQWQRDNISGNDLYFHRIRICIALVGKQLIYKNIAGQNIGFTIRKKYIQEIEKVHYAGYECLQIRVSDGLLRFWTYYKIQDFKCIDTIPDFNS